ncbi:hypothetical protein ACI2OX_01825 [Bacillus sp. N9]
MTNVIERSRLAMIEKFIRKTIDQPIYNEADWYSEVTLLGLQANQNYKIVLCVINHYEESINRFRTRDALEFVIHNVIAEVLNGKIPVSYGQFESMNHFYFCQSKRIVAQKMRSWESFL